MAIEKQMLSTKSDEDLMVLYSKGSQEAFEELYQRYSGRIFSFLKSKLNSKDLAQELLQECFFKLHRSKSLYDQSLAFAPWIFTIARTTLLDALKKKRIENQSKAEEFNSNIEKELISSGPIPSEIDLYKEYKDQAEPASFNILLEGLSASSQQVIKMRVVDESTFDEIAKKLGSTPENARQIFSRAIRAIRIKGNRKGHL